MNKPPSDKESINVEAEDLRKFSAQCLQSSGMNEVHAFELANLLTKSDLRGVRSHGTRALAGYCRILTEKRANPTPDIKAVSYTHLTLPTILRV